MCLSFHKGIQKWIDERKERWNGINPQGRNLGVTAAGKNNDRNDRQYSIVYITFIDLMLISKVSDNSVFTGEDTTQKV